MRSKLTLPPEVLAGVGHDVVLESFMRNRRYWDYFCPVTFAEIESLC